MIPELGHFALALALALSLAQALFGLWGAQRAAPRLMALPVLRDAASEYRPVADDA